MINFGGVVSTNEGFITMIGERNDTEYSCRGKKYNINYEGEIYNSDEIRVNLIERGYEFDTYLEEEVILKAYIEWKEKCLERFEGVFAIAIWSKEDRSLFLARDPIGAKALYYRVLKEDIVYSDEMKYLLKHPDIKPEVTYEGVCEVMLLGPSKRPDSAVFRSIAELNPGSFAIYKDGSFKEYSYWKFEPAKHNESFEDTVTNIREMLIDSIIKQVGEDDVCTLLSGGLDSSIVTAVTADIYKQFNKRLKTISVDYEGNDVYFTANAYQPNSDEMWIKRMSEFADTEHTTIKLDNESLLNYLGDAMRARDLPGMADIDTSFLLFCKGIKNYSNIGLGGECADEVFGGYPWFNREELLNSDFFPWISSLDDRIDFLSDEVKFNINAKNFAMDVYNSEISKVECLEDEDEKENKIRKVGYLTYRWFLSTLLVRQDKMSKYAGISIRAPFCNSNLMKYVYNIPWEMRAYKGREKGLLRFAFKDLLPTEVVERKKSPYPKTFNPLYTEFVRRELSHILDNPTSPIHEIINEAKVRELIASDVDLSQKPWYGQLMRGPQIMAFLIQVNMWMKEYRVMVV